MDCPRCGAFNSQLSERCSSCDRKLAGPARKASGEKPSPSPVSAYAERPASDDPPRVDPRRGLESTRRVGWAVGGLLAIGVLEIACTALGFSLVGYRTRVASGEIYNQAVAALNVLRPLGMSVGFWACGVGFLRWVRAAVRDITALRPDRRMAYTTSSATWAFIAPFLSLYQPYQVLSLLDRMSDPEAFPEAPLEIEQRAGYRDQPSRLESPPVPPRGPVLAWFLAWLASIFLPQAFTSAKVDDASVLVVTNAVAAVGALLAMRMVMGIDARLRELHRRARSFALGEAQPPETDEGRLGTLLSVVGAVATGAFAALVAARSHGLGVNLPWAAATAVVSALAVLAAGRARAARRSARAGLAATLLASTAALAATALLVRVELVRCAGTGDEAELAYQKLVQVSLDEGPDLPEKSAEALSALEELAERSATAIAHEYRCMGRRENEVAVALHAYKKSIGAPGEGPVTRAHLEAFRDASARLSESLGQGSVDRVLSCFAKRAVARSEGEAYVQRHSAPATRVARYASLARRASAEIALVDAESALPDELRKPGLLAAADPRLEALERARAGYREARREASAALRADGGGRLELESAALFEARKGFESKASYATDRVPAPPAPPGMTKTSYQGPLGKMLAYLSPAPSKKDRRPAVLWVPGIESFERDYDAAQELASAGVTVMLPTVRGSFTNPGRRDWNYGEIDDLAAAKAHLASLPYVDPERLLVVGADGGATRALLLSAAIDGVRGVVALDATLDVESLAELQPMLAGREGELRSPVRFAKVMTPPTYVVQSDVDSLEQADAMAEAAAGRAVRPLVCRTGACGAATLLKLVRSKVGEPGELSIEQDDIDQASRGMIRSGGQPR